jgi:hypothetical protein
MSTNPIVQKVLKAGGVPMLPGLQTNSPVNSRPASPAQKSMKRSVRFNVPSPLTQQNSESNTIDMESIQSLESATYEITTETSDQLKSVTFSVVCADDLDPLNACLKSIDLGSFSVSVSNPCNVTRDVRLSYNAVF